MRNEPNKAGAIWMAAKFPSRCAAGCAWPIARGDRMVWIPATKATYYESCAPAAARRNLDQCDRCLNGGYTHTLSCQAKTDAGSPP